MREENPPLFVARFPYAQKLPAKLSYFVELQNSSDYFEAVSFAEGSKYSVKISKL